MYSATKSEMKRGYWKIVDTETGETVRSGLSTATGAETIAAEMNARDNMLTYDRGGRLPVVNDFRGKII